MFIKDPSETLDYHTDWETWLGTDTIVTSVWDVPTGLTKVSDSFTSTDATIWLSGGVNGTLYTITNTVTTAMGRTTHTHVEIYVTVGAVAGGSPYNLRVQGIVDLSRYTTVMQQRKVSHDPLSGVVDGTNKIFKTQYFPTMVGSGFTVYVSGSAVATSSVDLETGTVEMAAAPTMQPDASYTFTPFTDAQLVSLLIAGYDEMQSRWLRPNWFLSGSPSSIVAADENSTGLYVVEQLPSGSVVDPPCSGSYPFSMCRTQIRLLMACCDFVYMHQQLGDTALTGISYRERSGAQLDRTRIPGNVKMALDHTEGEVLKCLRAAQDEYYVSGEQYGEAIKPQHSMGYETEFDWHDNTYPSMSEEWRWL